MENNKLILFKLAIGLGGLACFALLRRQTDGSGTTAGAFLRSCVILWLITRVDLFLTVFVFAGYEVTSDVPTYYYEPAKCVLAGQLPYRDFSTSYGPLFPYVAAAAVSVWDSPKAILLLAMAFEAGALLLWRRVAERTLPTETVRMGMLLYLCNPVAILNVAVAGQNQVWVSCLLAAAFALTLLRRDWLAGFLIGVSVVAVKLLGLMFVPYWWLVSRARRQFSFGLVLALALGLLPFWFAGADILRPLKLEGALTTSGNLPFLGSVAGLEPNQQWIGRGWSFVLLASLLGLSWRLARRVKASGDASLSLLGLTALLLVFMLVSKKSYTNYLNLLMLPLCFSAATVLRERWQQPAFLLWSCVAALEPSLWHRWLAQASLGEAWRRALAGGSSIITPMLFTGVELVLLAGYLALLWLILRQALTAGESSEGSKTAP